MYTFFIAVVLLLLGYFVYAKVVERIFGVDKERRTPAYTHTDGVDYVPMGWGKLFLIQFLNIAGLGPIFGAVMGAVYGPVAFLWIVFGSIFGGAVHDYLSGMLSLRNAGMSLPELVGKYMGVSAKQLMRGFTVFLMVLVGAVFVSGPAGLLAKLTPELLNFNFWAVAVFIYYILATLLPIDKIIGKIYPLFGAALIFMAVGVGGALIWTGAPVPELTFAALRNMHADPVRFPIFPMMFVSIACGAVSGFHATQSPLMARCLKNERNGRRVFYGAMIVEALVALIWAAAAMSFFNSVGGLQDFLAANNNNAAVVVQTITTTWLGKIGGFIAILGVIAAPITSGDTAFRSGRLIVADFLGYSQQKMINRVWVALPLFVIAFILMQVNFDVIWRYFAWSNQTLAAVTLWMLTIFLSGEKKCYLITLVPAVFMTAVATTYILIAPEGLQLPEHIAYIITTLVILLTLFLFYRKRKQ